jgi:hypothetical protein
MSEMEVYIENDPAFAEELFALFIKGLTEFREAFLCSMERQDPNLFFSAHHKVKTTLRFLNNQKLNQQTDAIRELLRQGHISLIDVRLQEELCLVCHVSIQNLQQRLASNGAGQ